MSSNATGGTDRRGALRLALAAAIAPSIVSRQAHAQSRAQVIPGGLIAPPEAPMVYRRTVTRDLVDGNSFSVSRMFTVEFQRFSEGFMVQGQQSDVAVDAPPALSAFADIEAARDESHIFPLALDPFGLILSRGQHTAPPQIVQQAVNQTIMALQSQQLHDDERDKLESFAAALHTAGQRITAYMPLDLFAPAGQSRNDEQDIALPDGEQGRVTTRFDGEIDSETGLMREASREIVTEVGSNRRTTSESWILALS